MFAPPAKKARRQRYTRSADDDERSGAAGPSSKRAKAAAVVLGDEEELDYGNQTLPVGRLPPDFDGIPTDGEMYLAVVRQQAKAHPAVLTAPSNPYAVVQLAPAPAAAASERSTALPTQEWREQYVTRFKAMREALAAPPAGPISNPRTGRLPRKGRADEWYKFVHGCAPDRPIEIDGDDWAAPQMPAAGRARDNAEPQDTSATEREPSAPLIKRLTTTHILAALTVFPYWFTLPFAGPAPAPVFKPLYARWLFALLAMLDGRLTSDEISTLRVLARACIAALALSRAKRSAKARLAKRTLEDEEWLAGEEGAWSVIAAVAGVWGQWDMWDDAATELSSVTQ